MLVITNVTDWKTFERREQNEVCRVLSNHYLSNHYLKKRGRRKSQQSRFSNLPSSRSGEGVVGVLDTDLSQRRPVARLAGSWEILDGLTFGVRRSRCRSLNLVRSWHSPRALWILKSWHMEARSERKEHRLTLPLSRLSISSPFQYCPAPARFCSSWS